MARKDRGIILPGEPSHVPRPHGVIIVDGTEVASTLQCCHCNNHFISVKWSGKKRGFCRNCMQVTCGKRACDPCKPFEEKLRQMERKR